MAEEPQTGITHWPGVRDWLRIFGAAKMALHPTKLGLALAALILMVLWGAVLDVVWTRSGQGVEAGALEEFIGRGAAVPEELTHGLESWGALREEGAPESGGAADSSAEANVGIFKLWRNHTLTYTQCALRAAVPFHGRGCGSVWTSVGMVCRGTRWLVSEHFLFALLFLLGTLAIWSLLGAAICRVAAVEFARDDKPGVGEALRFSRDRFFSGFFITPLLPVGVVLGIGLVMAIGGFFLWIPAVGNVAALFFPLALLGGLAIAFVWLGCAGGGSFFWPTVAAEGSDGFDAISRSFSYFFSRPVRTIFYGLTALVWGGICWVILKFILWVALRVTHACVSFGDGFGGGWGVREGAGEGVTKLDVLWRIPQRSDLYAMGDRSLMGGWEIFAAVVIGISVLLAIGLLWAFLVSFYFSASTIIYFLLRREVDATDYEEVYLEKEQDVGRETVPAGAPVSEAPPPAEEDTSPPADSSPPEPPSPTGQPEEDAHPAEPGDESDENA